MTQGSRRRKAGRSHVIRSGPAMPAPRWNQMRGRRMATQRKQAHRITPRGWASRCCRCMPSGWVATRRMPPSKEWPKPETVREPMTACAAAAGSWRVHTGTPPTARSERPPNIRSTPLHCPQMTATTSGPASAAPQKVEMNQRILPVMQAESNAWEVGWVGSP